VNGLTHGLIMQELELLDEDANIFKLVGPVLIKQDPLEATSNVKKRLEFIKGEVDRLDAQLKRLDDKQSKRQHTVGSVVLPCLVLLAYYAYV